ncbi:MAG: hypothetical protein Q8P60_02980 [Pseudorhodobacter sp.]|nr:hypothetical protein [Pseudorhodobacter sp.]
MTVYIGLGFAFVSLIDAIADIPGNVVGLATSFLLAALLGRAALRRRMRQVG